MRAAVLGSIATLAAATSLAAAQEALVAEGESVFRRCQACHAVGDGAAHSIGPHLNDLFGRQAGGLDDYNYSQAMRTAGEQGLVWDEDSLAAFLANPAATVRGTKMVFPGIRQEAQIAAVIAYLATFEEAEGETEGAGGSDGY